MKRRVGVKKGDGELEARDETSVEAREGGGEEKKRKERSPCHISEFVTRVDDRSCDRGRHKAPLKL